MNKAYKFWDKHAKGYDSSERQFDPGYRVVIAKTKSSLEPENKVLDFGCATGTKTLELAESAGHIHSLHAY
jgi:ubiquinone/menaquinone biosynthesis C-methylase UbiE